MTHYSHRFGDEPTEPVPQAPSSEVEEQMPAGDTLPADLSAAGLVETANMAGLPQDAPIGPVERHAIEHPEAVDHYSAVEDE